MNLMESRFIHLQKNFEGFIKTGISLIEYDGYNLIPSFTFDDLGIYIILPRLSWFFNISIEQSVNLFFYGITLASFFISSLGWSKVYNSRIQQGIAWLVTALLTYKVLKIGDVYLAYFFCINTLTPWAIYYAQKKHYTKSLLYFLFSAGFIISFFHYIRAYSGLGILLFILILFITSLTLTKKQWLKTMFAFTLGAIIPLLSFNYIYNQSINYIQNTLKETPEKNHVFWHSFYIGFGFLQEMNPGIVYADKAGEQKVQEIDPEITLKQTKRYESLLKHEVLSIIKNKWQFFIFTLFAKFGILIFYLLQFANIGLLCAFLFPKQWHIELSFFLAAGFYSIFPLLTMPYPEYSLGFISCVTLYGIVSINYALQQLFKNYSFKKYLSFSTSK